MPDINRVALRMDCKNGIDLTHPIDRMPEGSFPYLFNMRVLQEGELEARPGYNQFIRMGDTPNSIRRLNDPSHSFAPDGYIYVGGGGTNLYAGVEGNYTVVDGGYSGDPLSLIPFRPENSPESWMYVFDRNKNAKVRPDKVIRSVGIAPPLTAPVIEYGVPAFVDLNEGQDVSGWAATGGSTGPTLTDRTNGSTPSIVTILYNDTVNNVGWCCINPNITQPFWQGDRMKVILDPLGPIHEHVVVRDVLPAITSTTIAEIQYDSGNTGPASLVLVNTPSGLARNSLIQLDAEVVRVLEFNVAPDNTGYSLRVSTTVTHTAGEIVTGMISWYVYTTVTHAAGELIGAEYLRFVEAASGTGAAEFTGGVDASAADGRPIDPANDYLHISLFLTDPSVVTDIKLLASLDPAPNFSFTNPGNSWIWTITHDQLNVQGSSAGSWVEIVIPISSGVRSGSDLTRTFANISGLAIQIVTTGACDWGFDWWYFFGTYGEVIQPNSPVGVVYASRFRDSTTGARSVPGPITRYQLFPLREAVIITPETTTAPGVDTIDIYRQGGTITSLLYVASLQNEPSFFVFSYTDSLPDSAILSVNQPPDLTALQPWPILQAPWSGEVKVVGTSVIWISGDKFNTALLGNTAINLDGNVYLTYGQPRSDTFLEITQDAGFLASSNYQIASPTLAGQALPFAFGPLEGPFAPVIFALGDRLNGGLLYYTNPSDADSAGDTNTEEVSTPSSNLVSGAVWNGLVFAGSRDKLSCTRYSYLTGQGANPFQWADVPTPSGVWSRWAMCSTPIGVAYLGRDGVYIATDSGGVNITDERLYPLFPHDGTPAKQVAFGDNIILPVNMEQVNFLRLSYCDEALRFCYIDTAGNWNTLIYEIYKKRWLLNNYTHNINFHYMVEASVEAPLTQQILMMAIADNTWKISGGDTDDNAAINSVGLTPSLDGGDERSQKLYVDAIVQVAGFGTMQIAAAYNNAETFSPVLLISGIGTVNQPILNLASLADLALYRNIGLKFFWTGGPAGPRIMAFEAAGYLQPYLSKSFVTQFIPFSFPGWKHMRRMYPALISNGPVYFTIKCQDGRTFGPYTIPSTNGQYRQLPQMLNCNIKDLAFALQLQAGRAPQGGSPIPFAFFPTDFVIETKQWTEETYISLAVFRA